MDWNNSILLPIFTGLISGFISSSIVVLLGLTSIKGFIHERDRKREIGPLASFWDMGGDRTPFTVVCGREPPHATDEFEPRLGYAEAFGIMLVRQALNLIFGGSVEIREKPLDANAVLKASYFDGNLVIFGSEISLEKFGALSRALKIPYHQYHLNRRQRSFERLESDQVAESISSIVDDRIINYDIGSIVRLINPKNGRLIVLANGNYAAGLLAAISSVTLKDRFWKHGFVPQAPAQQLLIGVGGIRDNFITPGHSFDVLRGWLQFDLANTEFDSVLVAITLSRSLRAEAAQPDVAPDPSPAAQGR